MLVVSSNAVKFDAMLHIKKASGHQHRSSQVFYHFPLARFDCQSDWSPAIAVLGVQTGIVSSQVFIEASLPPAFGTPLNKAFGKDRAPFLNSLLKRKKPLKLSLKKIGSLFKQFLHGNRSCPKWGGSLQSLPKHLLYKNRILGR